MPTAPTTCGQGLAANAPLHAAMGRVAGATARFLAAHLPMLDAADPASAREREAYEELVRLHEAAAESLRRVADRMAAQRDLVMGRHVLPSGAAESMRDAFATFISAEDDLETLIDARLKEDRAMLGTMGK